MIEHKQFPTFSVEAFTQGKTAKNPTKPQKNEDRWIATPNYIAIIDGATANPPITIKGLSSGAYASDTIAKILQKAPSNLYGKELIDYISQKFQYQLDHLPRKYRKALEEAPYAKPYASLAVATLGVKEIVLTQLGDVSARVNGQTVYDNSKDIDRIHATQRIAAMNAAQTEDPEYTHEHVLQVGKDAIEPSLRRQVIDLQNNPNHPLGYGVIDGSPVHPKFIQTRRFPLQIVQTLELFSDGYFKTGDHPTIASWEKSFQEVEKEDPDKIRKYPSVKGSTNDIYTDDRTILIAKFK